MAPDSKGQRARDAQPDDYEDVAALLGREPAGAFEVVVRRRDGTPMVIANAPFLDDGTPMPTRYWLVDPDLRSAISKLEAAGGVKEAETAVNQVALQRAHERYATGRDRLVPADLRGPRPVGGVGGTARGVKCLHAHFASWLVGSEDPVGEWVADKLKAASKESLAIVPLIRRKVVPEQL